MSIRQSLRDGFLKAYRDGGANVAQMQHAKAEFERRAPELLRDRLDDRKAALASAEGAARAAIEREIQQIESEIK